MNDRKKYEEDLRERRRLHLENIERRNWRPCLHDACSECVGTGRKRDGTPCIHGIACPCPRCTPYCT